MGIRKKTSPKLRGRVRKILLAPFALLGVYFGAVILFLLLLNITSPPTTGVQIQRRIEALVSQSPYEKQYRPVRGNQISPHLRHAVVAAEDGRFYEHFGIDWEALREAAEENRRRGRRRRGGSTITQQLGKNLFMTTHSTYVRKALEVPVSFLAEILLSKERLLTVYLNVIEWGDGIYGAEAAARHYYGKSAADLTRREAASLAAILPSPRTRSPQHMGRYASTILARMAQMGW